MFIDAARFAQEQGRQLGGRKKLRGGPTFVDIQNFTGADLSIAHPVLALGEVQLEPGDDDANALADPIIAGTTPVAGNEGRFDVLAGPVASGDVQAGVVSGATWVRLLLNSTAHEFADIDPGNNTRLASAETGAAYILDAGSGGEGVERWAL